ncbi:MAG: AbfB domain-containing protein [Burkholderiales bacterium]|nr:AbfB domain-containing protein [Burkholderiales bacterium]
MRTPNSLRTLVRAATPRRGFTLVLAAMLAACGGGSSTTDGSAAGAGSDGRGRALAANTSLAVPIVQPADPLFDNLTIPASAATQGMWGPLQAWPMNAIHAALLPDGKLLTYGAPQNQDAQDGRTFDVWTPSLGFGGSAHATSFEAGRNNSFCSTAEWLPDGRLLVSGGNGARGSQLFNPATQSAANDTAQLADDRWYATLLALPDGRAVMLGGIDPYTEGMYQNPDAALQNGQVSMTPELYTPGTGWRSLTGAISRDAFGPDNLRASYPRAWVAPSGEVFGISADRMWWLDVYANGGTGAVRVAGTFKGAPSTTAPVNVGATNSAVMFAPGKVLQLGGNGGFNGDGFPASNMATVVDINGAAPVLTETARMAFARRFPSATVLPDGKVLVTGGTRVGNNGGSDAVFAAEMWNPASGSWTTLAGASRIRVYHSGALLMPNGTVMSLGGGTPGPQYNANAEVYYPPYLFQQQGSSSVLAARPVLTGINALKMKLGTTLQVEMQDGGAVARLVLVRTATVTHSFNNGQRFQELAFTQSGDRLSAELPASANLLPPGHYQLFALNAAGVPSRAVIVTLEPGAATLPRDVPLTLEATHVAASSMGVDGGGLGVLQPLAANPSAEQLASGRFIARTGLADAACVSLELAAQPGQWLRHQGYRLKLGTNDGSDLFKADATFCPEPGLAGHSLTLRSKNFPTYVLRARGGELWIDPEAADAQFRNTATWSPRERPDLNATPLPAFTPLPAPPVQAGTGASTVTWTPALDAAGLEFSWTFGDGTPATAWSATSAATHAFSAPGVYTVTLTARNAAGQSTGTSFVQAVYAAPAATPARHSSAMLLEPRTGGASTRLWVVNPDNNSVAVIDTATNARVAEIAVGSAPRTLARAPDGSVWVVNKEGASISVIDAGTLAVARTVSLPRASQPYGLVFAPNGSAAYVTLEAGARLLRLDPGTGAETGSLATGATPRHLAISGDSARLLVARFVTAALPGEGTASVSTTGEVGGEVWVIDTTTMTLASTVRLRHSDRTDTETQGSGIPNYLGAPAISADGRTAFVPGKQDNIKRGSLRSGLNLDFQNTVRAISSRIDLAAATPVELSAQRIDHDNAGVASAAAFDPTGAYLFVTLETSRQVAVVDAARGLELFRIEAGLAPQGVAVSADGQRLYVQNFMSRSVSIVDLQPLMAQGRFTLPAPVAVGTVGSERLTATVLKGKQLFYDARDPRLARDAYLSCAACHNDGGHDGRVWDLTGFGEGLRNTIALRGRAGMGHGRLHWSNNFDEVQDFEGQIRALAAGTGLMSDTAYFAGTRSQPLGDAKAGQSADLDALAAYVGSLSTFAPSAARTASGALSTAGAAGRTVFINQNCASCHSGTAFTRSSAGGDSPANIGTLKATSGKRLNATLGGIDVPTLRDVATTAPYLHDGSAATLEAAISAHAGVVIGSGDLANLAQYLREIGNEEASAPAPAATAGLLGTYYAGTSLAGTALLTRTEAVDFNWGNGSAASGLPADNFSVRWSGTVTVPTTGSYRFRTVSDDGVRLWVNGTQRINNWTDHAPTTNTSSAFSMTAGQRVSIRLEYYERGGGSTIRLQWLTPGSSSYVAVPASQLNPQ